MTKQMIKLKMATKYNAKGRGSVRARYTYTDGYQPAPSHKLRIFNGFLVNGNTRILGRAS